MISWRAFSLILVCLIQAASVDSLNAETVDDSAIVESLADSVWYDADQGVQPVTVKPVVDDSLNRDSRWLPKPKKIKKPKAATAPAAGGGTVGGGGNTGVFGSSLTLGNLIGWMVLLAVVVVLLGSVVYAMSKAELDLTVHTNSRRTDRNALPDEATIERMSHLPAELRRTDVNLRSEAERLMQEGQYDQAIILLFGHQLLLLDRVGMLRLNRGKTNRKYVRETRQSDVESSRRLQRTVNAFESSYFGRHVIDQEQFADLWNSNRELEQAVTRFQEVAA